MLRSYGRLLPDGANITLRGPRHGNTNGGTLCGIPSNEVVLLGVAFAPERPGACTACLAEAQRREDLILTEDAVAQLLDNLCRNLGFCLPPDERARLCANYPRTTDAFTDAVFIAEGLDPAGANRKLWQSVHERVVQMFDERT